MTAQDVAFLIARSGIMVLCAVAFVATLRHYRARPVTPPVGLPVHLAILGVLALGIGLMAYDGFENLVLRQGEPVSLGSWLWLSFDLAVPLLVLHAMPQVARLDAAIAALSEEANTDPLTGLANRRGFHPAAEATVLDCRARGLPVALIAFDLDRFKAINDRHGHEAGDEVLRRMGALLRRDRRAGDIAARLGGEEFILLCPGLDAAGAQGVADRLRAELRRDVPHPGGAGEAVTTSAGVAAVGPEKPVALAVNRALGRADEALYAAKAAGRDRVMLAPAGGAKGALL